jgi:hypothetical protein
MPSRKKDECIYDIHEEESQSDVYSVDIDEDGNPYIEPDLHNLGTDTDKVEWTNRSYDDLVKMYEYLISYRDNEANSHFFEKITYNKFLKFVAQNSYQIA